VCLLPYLRELPEELGDEFVDRVVARAEDPVVLEYVRLNMTARRG
jgi:hypothetical protein